MECRDPNLRDAVQVVSATTGSGPAIVSSTLVPDALPGKTSDMVLAGTRIPVQIVTKHDGQEFMIELRAHGQTFEQERYVDGPTAFSFHGTSDETYVPDIDLVRFPMHVGDSWDWSGTVSSGGISRKASAEVKTSPKSLYFGDASAQAIEVEVDLSLFSQGEKLPASRKLKFDFVPGQGILRREFGDASVREPSKP
jgi:hypothetical protein